MKDEKKRGITLITLIITIVVMVILASMIIATIQNTNSVGRAKETKFKAAASTYQDELKAYIAYQDLTRDFYDSEALNATGTNLSTLIASFDENDADTFKVIAGELVVSASASNKQKNWAREIGVKVEGDPDAPVLAGDADSIPAVSYVPRTLPPPEPSISARPTPAVTTNAPVIVSPGIDNESLATIRAKLVADRASGYPTSTSRVSHNYYGKTVNYSVTSGGQTLSDWKIIFIDDSNIYLISSTFVPIDTLPKDGSGNLEVTKSNATTASIANAKRTSVAASNLLITKSYIPSSDLRTFNVTLNSTTNRYEASASAKDNIKNVLYLLDEDVWTCFVDPTYAVAAYGGVPVRMMWESAISYDPTYKAKTLSTTATGYKIWGINADDVINENLEGADLYCQRKSVLYFYWLIGPSNNSNTSVNQFKLTSSNKGQIAFSVNTGTSGFRPMVALKSGVKLTTNTDTSVPYDYILSISDEA